ncbi:EG45-like domain-containing protein [Cinnamomum micranthum f. kanehirae]|uniref:EG45-like domain-containing protein n=1 Tax=Cinnamomum micranthum f. kanehirae TaxID=337451 RepID=A0A3S3MXW9_9MAGN|nr:EG45-like domain-containing protein [Cinnamomum micranthum f. kanehirae]
MDNGAPCGREYLVTCLSAAAPNACIDGQTIQVMIVDYIDGLNSSSSQNGTTMVLSNNAVAMIGDQLSAEINIEFQQYSSSSSPLIGWFAIFFFFAFCLCNPLSPPCLDKHLRGRKILELRPQRMVLLDANTRKELQRMTKNNIIAYGRLKSMELPKASFYRIVLDETVDGSVDLFDGERKLGDVILGDVVDFIGL